MHVAARVRERRIVLGISQQKLAAALDLTYQQVHKYEQGKNRISVGRLYDFGKVLAVPITFFFEGIADTSSPAAPLATGSHTDSLGREAVELFTAYRAISDPMVRRRLLELARALGSGPNGSTAAKQRPSQNRTPLPRVGIHGGRGAAQRYLDIVNLGAQAPFL